MADQTYNLVIEGERKEWNFLVLGDEESVRAWRDDGLAVYEVVNTVPVWIADLGLVRVWCFLQDLFHFRWMRHG